MRKHLLVRVFAGLALWGSWAIASDTAHAQSQGAAAVPAKGWHANYDTMIVSETRKHPELTRISGTSVGALCPKWDRLGEGHKRRFYANLLRIIARFESDHDPATMALEKAMSIDPVTKRQVVSEGLLQLSYQDQRNFPGCNFDFAGDRARFEEDWSLQDSRKTYENALLKGWTAKNADRSILAPGAQFACAVAVLSRAARASQREGKSLLAKLGYWQNLDGKTNPTAYRRIMAQLDAETPYCR